MYSVPGSHSDPNCTFNEIKSDDVKVNEKLENDKISVQQSKNAEETYISEVDDCVRPNE